GLYAVGNFKPSEDTSLKTHVHPPLRQPPPPQPPPQPQPVVPPPAMREPLRPLPNLNTDPPRLLPPKSLSMRERPTSARSESILLRGPSHRETMSSLKRASTEVECITPPSPLCKESFVTFSNTLPRVHSTGIEEPVPRRHAAIHASMDSTRSKQLLSQWKTKNENRKLSLQVMEAEAGQLSPQRNMELRCSSEPSAMGLDGELRGGPPGQYMKLAASAVPLANHNSSGGLTGGARVSIQSRPGSSQLVHIPEETQENVSCSPHEDGGEMNDGGGGNARSKWLKVAEKSTACRTNSQPRIMQVIAMSKQQGMLHGSPKSEASTVSCTGSIRYKALMDQEPNTGIVRVEAHPENKPVVKPPSTDGSGSWRWKPQERGSIRQSLELNDLNRDSESCESLKDGYGSIDGNRSLPDMSNPHHPHFHHHHHQQSITTIRVTPVEASSEATSETLSTTSSRDSTLRRKGNIILLPDRGPSPDNARNLPHFFKPSPTPPPILTFK
ncbi:hypothetical protein M9458_003645, partial [Cirrhinus mrigala]